MNRIKTDLPGVLLLEPDVHADPRGFFMETWNEREFAELGITAAFVQDNHSRSVQGTLRGLHYQLASPQAKILRVVQGAVFDVAVDIRRNSPTFGRWAGAELSGDNRRMIYIPGGFAHGFYCLTDTADSVYKCSDFYRPDDERGIIWNDPEIGIEWPFEAEPLLSARDASLPGLAEADLPTYV